MSIQNVQQTVVPYIMVGNAGKFIDFAKNVFDAEVVLMNKLREDSEAVVHAEMRIGGSTVMFADSAPAGMCDDSCRAQEPSATIQMFVYVENADATCRRAVEAGATIAVEPGGEYGQMGGIIDPFGHLWWVNSEK